MLATMGVAAMSGGMISPDHAAAAVDVKDDLAVSAGSESSWARCRQ
jgi:hypothetical protein